MKLAWYLLAERDLEQAAAYVRLDNPAAADKVELRLRTAVEHLARFPDAGRPGRTSGTRELVVRDLPFVIRYRVKDDAVQILRIFHTARRWVD